MLHLRDALCRASASSWGMPDVDDDGNDASGIVSPEQEVEILGGVFAMQKTQEGLQNCWAENDDVVMRMHQGHPDLYEQIVKHYQNAQKKLTEV